MSVAEHRLGHRVLHAVDLIEDGESLLRIGSELLKHMHRRRMELEDTRVRGVE